MERGWLRSFKEFLRASYNTNFRKSTLLFCGLVLIAICLSILVRQLPAAAPIIAIDPEVQKQVDSLKGIAKTKKYTPKPFNPNFITDYKGYILGMSNEEIDRLHAFRAKDQWIRSAEHFQEVTQIPDSVLSSIAPFFRFPEFTKNKKTKETRSKDYQSNVSRFDLNTVSVETLVSDFKLPSFLAKRIINYRKKIGMYRSCIQLEDIYGLRIHQRKQLLLYCDTSVSYAKVDINEAAVKDMINPYVDFETALRIRDYRHENRKINNFQELKEIEGFPSEKINRIALYLEIK